MLLVFYTPGSTMCVDYLGFQSFSNWALVMAPGQTTESPDLPQVLSQFRHDTWSKINTLMGTADPPPPLAAYVRDENSFMFI